MVTEEVTTIHHGVVSIALFILIIPGIQMMASVMNLSLFIGVMMFFMLLEVPEMPGRVSRFFGGDPTIMSQVTRMSRYIIDILIVRTETNVIHGILFGGSLMVMGVHGAAAWGLLTFIPASIPCIGLILSALPAMLFAFIQSRIWGTGAVIAIICMLDRIVLPCSDDPRGINTLRGVSNLFEEDGETRVGGTASSRNGSDRS